MFYCRRTDTSVTVSPLENYAFYNQELNEDLFLFETYAKCSKESKIEAEYIISTGYVDNDFSSNKPLLNFVNDYLKSGVFNLKNFKKLDVLKYTYFEYDEAVLISIIYNLIYNK